MKRYLQLIFMLIIVGRFIFAGDLFFSEYIEGSSNNKALEIYNPTDQAVDLSNYGIIDGKSDGGWYDPDPLIGTLLPHETYVIVNPDFALFDITSSIVDSVWGQYVTWYNGDDARGLVKFNGTGGYDIIDLIGDDGGAPASGGWEIAGVTNATVDHTLIRKPTVTEGNTDWAVSAGTNAEDSEWIVYEIDTYDLGTHQFGGSTGNSLPIADAGVDQTVPYGSLVTLDGSESYDPGGTIESYAWAQISGSSVTLSSTDQAVVTFTAPDDDAVLEFTLTVVDDSSTSDIDTVMIIVVDGSPSPIFFSEYIEGSGNSKALEIYNASETAVDLSEYTIRSSYNGNGWNSDYYSFPEGAVLQPGDVYVIANSGADQAILDVADEQLAYNDGGYVVSFNGNDARGLFRNGLLVDVIGVPDEDPGTDKGWSVAGTDDATINHTLIRKPAVVTGNADWSSSAGTTVSRSEWTVYDLDVFDYLGTHSANPDAPVISDVTLTNDFPTSITELEVTATITAVTGQTIASAKIKYGSGGLLNNETDMWQDNGDVWMGLIPSQPAYTELEYQVVATDDAGNAGESASQMVLIADENLTDLAVIRSNKTQYIDNYVTVKGIVTIGSGVIDDYYTDAYMQDESGRGINLFDFSLIPGLDRGDELIVVGIVTEYNNVLEITDFKYKELSTGNDLPAVKTISLSAANSLEYEGTLVKFNGIIADTSIAGYGTTLEVELNGDTSYVRIWDDTGINAADYAIGSSYWFTGVINPYYDDFQLVVGYAEDIEAALGIAGNELTPMKFQLNAAYPNPFNPTTLLSWQLAKSGEYELSAYNILGQKVADIAKGFAPAGKYSLQWNAGDLPTGAYFIRLKSGDNIQTQKVLLLK